MWIEAVLASMLLVTAMLLLNQQPQYSSPLTDTLASWQLEDRLALLAEFGSDAGLQEGAGAGAPAGIPTSDSDLRRIIFNNPEPFCYRWAWLNESNSFAKSDAEFHYSEDDCAPSFNSTPSTLRSLRRGAWRAKSLQFLLLEQAPKN